MEQKIVIAAFVLMGTGLLISALSGSLTSVAVQSCVLAVFGYSAFRSRR